MKINWKRYGWLGVGFLFLFACTSQPDRKNPSELNLFSLVKINSLDPVFSGDVYTQEQVANVYETLYGYHYLKRPYEIEPLLAQALPRLSKDGRTYTIELKKGVLFQDDPCFRATEGLGRELTADDVVYSLLRLADPKVASEGWWILAGAIQGLDEWRKEATTAEKTDYLKKIEGLQAIGRYKVKITLVKPIQGFIHHLAMPFASIVPPEAVNYYGDLFFRNPVGTGPYRLQRDESNLGSRLVWVKNPTYREEYYPSTGEKNDAKDGLLSDAGRPLPFEDRVVVQIFQNAPVQWMAFRSGDLDLTSISADHFAEAITPARKLSKELSDKGIRLLQEMSSNIVYEAFNMRDPLIGENRMLRLALSAAYNIEPVIELFYNGRAIPAHGPIPPTIEGYDPSFKNTYGKYSLARSKELLRKAGFPGGSGLPELEYGTVKKSFTRQMAEYLKKSFAAVGVKIKIREYTWNEFRKAVKEGRGHLWSRSWDADYPDPLNFLQLFYGANKSPGPNDSGYGDAEFDKLYEKARGTPRGKERDRLIRQMVGKVTSDAPWIFDLHRVRYVLTQPWLKNYKIGEFVRGYAKYLRADQEEKNKWHDR